MTITSYRQLTVEAITMNRMLGGNDGPFCKYCDSYQKQNLHKSDCTLFKIRPTVLQEAINERSDKMRKEANRQILFYNDKRYTKSRQRINRKMSTRPKRKFTTLFPHER